MIKILSGWSNPGGSTIANMRLCDLFIDRGLACEFYGPHDWHLDKCKGAKELRNFDADPSDILIIHFLPILEFVGFKKLIFSLHETNLVNLKKMKEIGLDNIDAIHYVSNSQRAYHAVNHPYKIIPNVVPKLELSTKCEEKVAGVIGSIDRHKRPHLSIQRALKDGFDKVKVFGAITDPEYAKSISELKLSEVELMGHCDNQLEMYSQISKVYNSSQRETFNFVKAECEMLGIEYEELPESYSGAEYWEEDRIFESWTQLLDLKI